MNLMKFFYLLAVSTLIFSCGKSDTPPTSSNDPTNLNFEVVIADDNSGFVTVNASAQNAVSYEFDMGTLSGGQGTSESGAFSYTYETTGQYVVEVKAYGSSGRFIKDEKIINIIAGEPTTSGQGYTTPITYPDMNLFWNDEFDGNILNSNWTHEIGNGCPNLCGWGNGELEYYRAENTLVRDGVLTIEARKQDFQNNEYTSSRIKTQGKKVFTYGRVDVRAKLPRGQGLWPAIWLLGQNITSVSWPSCGEIDIMEMVGGNGGESKTYGTAHWQKLDGEKGEAGTSTTVPVPLDEAFHVFSIIWTETEIKWYVDDVPFHTVNISGPNTEAFHKPFFIILNVAVGGVWPGSPTEDTVFPTSMEVDYVRVFQDK